MPCHEHSEARPGPHPLSARREHCGRRNGADLSSTRDATYCPDTDARADTPPHAIYFSPNRAAENETRSSQRHGCCKCTGAPAVTKLAPPPCPKTATKHAGNERRRRNATGKSTQRSSSAGQHPPTRNALPLPNACSPVWRDMRPCVEGCGTWAAIAV